MKMYFIVALSLIIGALSGSFLTYESRSNSDVANEQFNLCFKSTMACNTSTSPEIIYGSQRPPSDFIIKTKTEARNACVDGSVIHKHSFANGYYTHVYECSSDKKYVYVVNIKYKITLGSSRIIEIFPSWVVWWAPCQTDCSSALNELRTDGQMTTAHVFGE